MKRILIVVDMQHDFIDGALKNETACSMVLPNVVEKIRINRKNGDFLIFTQDTHEKDYLETFEGKHLPVTHCVKGTKGWQLHEKIMELSPCFKEKCLFLEKNTFGCVGLKSAVESFCKEDRNFELEICGMCTDICVIANALLCRTWWPDKRILIDAKACMGTTEKAHQAALEVMRSCQIEQLNSVE